MCPVDIACATVTELLSNFSRSIVFIVGEQFDLYELSHIQYKQVLRCIYFVVHDW